MPSTKSYDIQRCKTRAEKAKAGHQLGQMVKADTSYISHGELMEGLAQDANNWVQDIEERLSRTFAEYGDANHQIYTAISSSDDIIGVLSLSFGGSERHQFLLVEDLAVHPEYRGMGVGQSLMDKALSLAKEKQLKNVYLESGIQNHQAHEFFETRGFVAISKVFRLDLDQS